MRVCVFVTSLSLADFAQRVEKSQTRDHSDAARSVRGHVEFSVSGLKYFQDHHRTYRYSYTRYRNSIGNVDIGAGMDIVFTFCRRTRWTVLKYSQDEHLLVVGKLGYLEAGKHSLVTIVSTDTRTLDIEAQLKMLTLARVWVSYSSSTSAMVT